MSFGLKAEDCRKWRMQEVLDACVRATKVLENEIRYQPFVSNILNKYACYLAKQETVS